MNCCTDLVTKLPGVGSSIEAARVATCYLDNVGRIQAKQSRFKLIQKGLEEQRKHGCRFASQENNLECRIGRLRTQMKSADEEIKQEGVEALKKAGMIVVQEVAGAAIPGGGSIIAGVMRARESAMELNNSPQQAFRDGAREGVQDYCYSFAAEQLGQGMGCPIM